MTSYETFVRQRAHQLMKQGKDAELATTQAVLEWIKKHKTTKANEGLLKSILGGYFFRKGGKTIYVNAGTQLNDIGSIMKRGLIIQMGMLKSAGIDIGNTVESLKSFAAHQVAPNTVATRLAGFVPQSVKNDPNVQMVLNKLDSQQVKKPTGITQADLYSAPSQNQYNPGAGYYTWLSLQPKRAGVTVLDLPSNYGPEQRFVDLDYVNYRKEQIRYSVLQDSGYTQAAKDQISQVVINTQSGHNFAGDNSITLDTRTLAHDTQEGNEQSMRHEMGHELDAQANGNNPKPLADSHGFYNALVKYWPTIAPSLYKFTVDDVHADPPSMVALDQESFAQIQYWKNNLHYAPPEIKAYFKKIFTGMTDPVKGGFFFRKGGKSIYVDKGNQYIKPSQPKNPLGEVDLPARLNVLPILQTAVSNVTKAIGNLSGDQSTDKSPSNGSPLPLSTKGTKIMDSSGKTVTFKGLTSDAFRHDLSFMNYNSAQDVIDRIKQTKSWGVNAIQFYVNPLLFSGDSTKSQQNWANLKTVVDWMNKNGMYANLNPVNDGYVNPSEGGTNEEVASKQTAAYKDMPNFLTKLATTFKDDANVSYGLEAEPKWPTYEDSLHPIGEMQKRVDAIKAVSPNALIAVPTSPVPGGESGIALTDRLTGTNLIYNRESYIVVDPNKPKPSGNFDPATMSNKDVPTVISEYGFLSGSYANADDLEYVKNLTTQAHKEGVSTFGYAIDQTLMGLSLFDLKGNLTPKGEVFKNVYTSLSSNK